ncbi:hypothetical protein D1B31_02390 [Neobacillus notoginsengisoli]|uniref:Uncharacterized protein n=1 Tax=Neobacillus notoginsengisoli TaxID=1578198 RepID=A0A417Z0C2_9BACI|nr:hypothetical protein [Neobacillus notoginsengisoli]RHW43525.1 hypothetical protein D1B31_02390 [Neobacillus notoginsengisoli]
MDKLKKKLQATLLENPAVQIKKSLVWHMPVTTYSVAFSRVKRSKMEILMKMMLLTFEQTQIRRAANLSELLLVEELFIEDLLKKLQRMGLIRLEKGAYILTPKGNNQLKTGIMEEELEEEATLLSYSPFHDEFWPEMNEPLPETDKDLPLYRYIYNQNRINEEKILRLLSETENGEEEDGFQTVVTAVNRFEQQKIEPMPCLEFQLYNKEQDTFFARVWNTRLGRWDEAFEKQIEEKERMKWREELASKCDINTN